MKSYLSFIKESQYICPFCLNNYILKNPTFITENLNSYDDIRSISIVVPTNGCVNKCRFCVSRMHQETYDDMTDNPEFEQMYFEKLKLCKDRGAKFAIITGTAEPLQNKKFLEMIGRLNQKLGFELELQTSGVLLNETNLNFLKEKVGLNLISLSISGLMEDNLQTYYTRMHRNLQFNLKEVCHNIKEKGFLLRISLNLVDAYEKYTIDEIFERLSDIHADQAIFRILWRSGKGDEIDDWIKNHSVSKNFINRLVEYVQKEGEMVGKLPDRYMIKGVSVVVDDDCMGRKPMQQFRYLILRSDCNLYTKWDSKDKYQ